MRSKKFLIKLIAALLIMASMVTFAACESADNGDGGSNNGNNVYNGPKAEDLTPSEGLTFALTSDKKGYQLKSASKCKDSKIVIPSTYSLNGCEALPVTTIAAGAFKSNTKTLEEVYIPDSVTKIASGTEKTLGAFEDCTSLTTVVCGSGLLEIGNRAFYNCKSIKTLVLQEGVTKFGSHAFAGCESIETIVIPDSVTSIGESCYQRCSGATSVILGAGLKTQDTVKNGKVTKNKDEIGKFAFYFCKNISTVKYNGTKEDFEALHMDVSCFLSTTMTDYVICKGGEKSKIPELEGQNELPVDLEGKPIIK